MRAGRRELVKSRQTLEVSLGESYWWAPRLGRSPRPVILRDMQISLPACAVTFMALVDHFHFRGNRHVTLDVSKFMNM